MATGVTAILLIAFYHFAIQDGAVHAIWLLPLIAIIMVKVSNRFEIAYDIEPNYCSKCGYDLRGTLAAGRSECPECGHPIEREAKAQP